MNATAIIKNKIHILYKYIKVIHINIWNNMAKNKGNKMEAERMPRGL